MNALKRTHNTLAERERTKLYQEMFKDLGSQCVAMMLYTLDTRYGWKTKRLTELTEAFTDTSKMLDTLTFRDKADAIDCREWAKKTHGIDTLALPWELEIEK